MPEIHKLIVERPNARTACGKKLIAIYTPSYSGMTDEAGAENVFLSPDGKGVTCKACKEEMKK